MSIIITGDQLFFVIIYGRPSYFFLVVTILCLGVNKQIWFDLSHGWIKFIFGAKTIRIVESFCLFSFIHLFSSVSPHIVITPLSYGAAMLQSWVQSVTYEADSISYLEGELSKPQISMTVTFDNWSSTLYSKLVIPPAAFSAYQNCLNWPKLCKYKHINK